MEKIIPVNFCTDEYSTILHDGVVQWDIGIKLKISGLDVSTDMVEVHFSLTEKNGEAKRMLGEVIDGDIIVSIPKIITEAPEQRRSFYEAYAFVYLIGEDSARTVRKITMYVQSKPKPDGYASPSELSFLEQLEVAIRNKISIPDFAEVGQVIAVKAVDENGKPIEFEAVTQSGGGGIGNDGVGIESVEQTTTSTEDGGINVVTVTKTDGTQSEFKVRNGSKGSKGDKGDKGDTGDVGPQGPQGEIGPQGEQGPQGETGPQGDPGYTPQKGVDYYTEDDKKEMVDSVLNALPTWQGGAF